VEKHPHSNIRIILDKMAARAGAAYKQLMARLANLNLDSEPDPRVQLLKKRWNRISIEIPERNQKFNTPFITVILSKYYVYALVLCAESILMLFLCSF
jgi:hypothetical protein